MHSQLGCMVRFCSKGICSPTGRHSYEYTFRRGFQCRLHLLTTHSDTVIMQSLTLCRTVVTMTVSLHRARACAALSGEAPCRAERDNASRQLPSLVSCLHLESLTFPPLRSPTACLRAERCERCFCLLHVVFRVCFRAPLQRPGKSLGSPAPFSAELKARVSTT